MTLPEYVTNILDLIPMKELENYLDARRAKTLKACEVVVDA